MPSRRDFLRGLGVTSTATALGLCPRRAAAEPPPETATIRLGLPPSLYRAHEYLAGELFLRSEGFSDVRYVKQEKVRDIETTLASGEVNIGAHFVAPLIVRLEQRDPVVVLAGLHVGCFELFGGERVRTVRDLRGKTVAVPDLQTGPITFISSMAAHVGLDPRKDIRWVMHPSGEAMRLLAEGKIDAYLGLVDKGLAKSYDSASQTMRDLPYARWRHSDPEDTMRFYALRLHEAGMIKSSPQKIIAQGTDWRFLNELKRELKG